MSTTENQILSLVKQLSQSEQLRIMHAILNMLENEGDEHLPPIDANNLKISEKRSQEYDEGKIKVLNRQEFWNRLQARHQGK